MSAKNDLEIETRQNYWHHTARSIKIFGIHAIIVIPVIVLLFWPRLWVLGLLVLTAGFLILIERFGYTPTIAYRALKSRLGGETVSRVRRVGARRIWK